MKITRRKDKRNSGTFLVSVPVSNIERLESALTFLADQHDGTLSSVVVTIIEDAARRAGWKDPAPPSPDLDT